jgi:hypothetical protein
MAYPRRLLNDHETVVVDLHPHWSCLVKPIVLLVGAMTASIVVRCRPRRARFPARRWVGTSLGLIVAAAVGSSPARCVGSRPTS